MRDVPYHEAVGSLMYMALGTRPNIAYAVQTVSRFTSKPGLDHCIRKRGVGFKATQSSLGVSEDSKDIKDPKRSGKSQVKVYLELNL